MRTFEFVLARALVTEIKKLREDSLNGLLQPDDIWSFFTGSHVEVHESGLLQVMEPICLLLLEEGCVVIVYANFCIMTAGKSRKWCKSSFRLGRPRLSGT